MIRIKNNITPRLPNGYQELEYIESTGTQYINTQIKANTVGKYVLDVQFTNLEFGINGAIYQGRALDIGTLSNKFFMRNGAANDVTTIADTNRHEFVVDAINSKCSIDGTIVSRNSGPKPDFNLFLFARNNESLGTTTVGYYCKEKLYSCKIYNLSNELVHYFIPCYRKSDNEIGLYDLINNVFYANAGTGVFLMGAEVNKPYGNLVPNFIANWLPSEYQPVEYIESTGTQHVNTNCKITPNTEIIVDGMIIGNGYFAVAGRSGYYMSGIYGNSSTSKICARWRNGASSNLTVTTSEDIGENRHTFKLNKTAFYIDNVNKGNFNSTYNFSATDDIYVFGLGEASMSIGRIYSMTISDNGVLVRDFIPCCRKSDNTAGLYDLVNNTFYTNQGAGTFMTGEEISNTAVKKTLKRYVGEKLVYGEKEAEYEQQVNYAMIYDNSLNDAELNKCVNSPSGGWTSCYYYSSSYSAWESNANYLKASVRAKSSCTANWRTTKKIKLDDYAAVIMQLKHSYVEAENVTFTSDTTGLRNYDICWVGVQDRDRTNDVTHECIADTTNITGEYYLSQYSNGDVSAFEYYIYNSALFKKDDWQTLCSKAGLNPTDYNNENTLCKDTTAISTILSNQSAVQYMIYNCTGSFMAYFVVRETCLTALNNSPYKTLIQANKHWNKFLNMVA